MKKVWLGILILIFSLLNCALAAETQTNDNTSNPGAVAQSHRCADTHSDLELATCLDKESQSIKVSLQELERQVMEDSAPQDRKLFEHTSQAWGKFVEASCAYDSSEMTGAFGGMHASDCQITLNTARINALKEYIHCIDTDDCGRPILLYPMLFPSNTQ